MQIYKESPMRAVRIFGLIMFLFGATVGLLDLLDLVKAAHIGNSFYLALILMVVGISLTFFTPPKEEVRE